MIGLGSEKKIKTETHKGSNSRSDYCNGECEWRNIGDPWSWRKWEVPKIKMGCGFKKGGIEFLL